MIKHLEGRNVGGFEKLSVDLEPITVLVGPNASGKSTVMRALRSLALIARSSLYDQRTGLLRLAGVATIADLFRDPAQETELAVTAASEDGEGRYAVTLGFDNARGRVEVRREFVDWSSTLGHDFKFDSTTDQLEFSYHGSDITTAVPRRTSLPHLAFSFWKKEPRTYAHLTGLYELTSCFSPFFVYRFSPGSIAQPASPADPVGYDGAGLAAALDRLLGEDRTGFDKIVDGLKAQFDHLSDIRIRTIQNFKKEPLKLFEFERKDGRRVPAGLESDGVLLSLAYSWLRFQEGSPAIGVEEPETAAYPSLIRQRVSLLKALAFPSDERPAVQVIATTHSPFFLTALGDPDAIRVCDPSFSVVKCPQGESISDTIYTRLNWSVEG